jgi:quercetin dioxygenase-like cupin family protein
MLCVRISIFAILASMSIAQQQPVPVEDEPHHHVVLKNEHILVMRVTIPAGQSTQYHIHPRDRVAIGISTSTLAEQELNKAQTPPGPSTPGRISARREDVPYTHRVINMGQTDFDVIDVEAFHRPEHPADGTAGTVIAENPSLRVYKYVLAAGASSPMHTHERPYLIVAATTMQLKMSAPDGQSMSYEIKAGDFHWIDSKVTHSLANVGSTEGQIVEVELK